MRGDLMKTCSFFGHRYLYDNIDEKLIEHIEYAINKLEVIVFYVGGYGNFDSKVTSVMIDIRKKYPHIKLYLALAYLPLEKDNIALSKWYDGTIYFEGLEFAVKRFAISKRNTLIVDNSDVIICYITRDHGGAYKAVAHAKRLQKTIYNCIANQKF